MATLLWHIRKLGPLFGSTTVKALLETNNVMIAQDFFSIFFLFREKRQHANPS